MHKLYILKSVNHKKSYVGITTDIGRRLEEHNSGKGLYTDRYKPWILIYQEEFSDRETARKREKYLKSAVGRKFLKKIFDKYCPVG